MKIINSIKLNNFKCYIDKEFNLSPLTVFCGNNSVGKSTAIQALTLLYQSRFSDNITFNGELISLGYYDDVHNCYVKDDESISVTINAFENDISWYCNERINDGSDSLKWVESSGSPQELLSQLSTFQYLRAERLGPRDNYNIQQGKWHEDWLGAQGENTAEVLSKIKDNRRFGVMKKDDNNELIFQINKDDPRIHDNAKDVQIFNSISAWMQEISPGFSFDSRNERMANVSFNIFKNSENKEFRPINMGFGLSYSLSVVTALLNSPAGSIVIIENPEAHLHPKGQSYLGRLITKTVEAGVQVIIETHSDHLLNGIRVAARLSDGYQTGLAKVIFVSSGNGEEQSNIEELPIDSDGEIPYWPDGFFDQQALDIRSIMSGENVTKIERRRTRERK